MAGAPAAVAATPTSFSRFLGFGGWMDRLAGESPEVLLHAGFGIQLLSMRLGEGGLGLSEGTTLPMALYPSALGLSHCLAAGTCSTWTQYQTSDCCAGQQQLLCLARALLRRPVVVCLDECTASVDPATAELMQQLIQEQLAGSTVIQASPSPVKQEQIYLPTKDCTLHVAT